MLDQAPIGEVVVDANQSPPLVYEMAVATTPGRRRFRAVVRRIKDGLSQAEALRWKSGSLQKGTIFLEWLEIEGPFYDGKRPSSHTKIFGESFRPPTADQAQEETRRIVHAFAQRAYRRPLGGSEIESLCGLAARARAQGDSFEECIETALRGNLERQVRRMLADPKSRALVDNFAGQWLQFRNLETVAPDRQMFKTFNEPLRQSMRRETELLFETILREDRSILEVLDANYTFVDETLARHYGLPRVEGTEFRHVDLHGTHRRGVLTHASVLTLTSNPTRTSPVKRGKWVLENLFNTPPPPPPPNVPELNESKEALLSGSLRQRMEKHRDNPLCASCHTRMDAIGFGLENFDAIGAWREMDGAFPVESGGALGEGESFQNSDELLRLLSETKGEAFVRCLAEKMLTYALGRGLEYYDKCAIDQICRSWTR